MFTWQEFLAAAILFILGWLAKSLSGKLGLRMRVRAKVKLNPSTKSDDGQPSIVERIWKPRQTVVTETTHPAPAPAPPRSAE